MNGLIKETNENLKIIIDTMKENLDSATSVLENIQLQMDKKVEEAKKYKIQVDSAKENIRNIEEDNRILEISLNEINEKYSKMNLVSLIEAGNKEINEKISNNIKDINRNKEEIAELTSKARTIKDLLINMKKDRTAKEEKLENLRNVYEFYSKNINELIKYSYENMDDLQSFKFNYYEKKQDEIKEDNNFENTMVFDEIAYIDENKNFKDEMTFINNEIENDFVNEDNNEYEEETDIDLNELESTKVFDAIIDPDYNYEMEENSNEESINESYDDNKDFIEEDNNIEDNNNELNDFNKLELKDEETKEEESFLEDSFNNFNINNIEEEINSFNRVVDNFDSINTENSNDNTIDNLDNINIDNSHDDTKNNFDNINYDFNNNLDEYINNVFKDDYANNRVEENINSDVNNSIEETDYFNENTFDINNINNEETNNIITNEDIKVEPNIVTESMISKKFNLDDNTNDNTQFDLTTNNRINELSDLLTNFENAETKEIDINNVEERIENTLKEEPKDATMLDIFGNPISTEDIDKSVIETKKIEELFIENGINFNKFKEDEQTYLKQIYDENKFIGIFNVLNKHKINVDNLYNSFNIFGEINFIELDNIINKLVSIGQSVESIGFILEKMPKIKKYNLDEAIASFNDEIKNVNITELIMRAKELYNGGNK